MNKYIAIYAETNVSGIGIIEIERGSEDYIISEKIPNGRKTRSKLCYSAEGRPFFRKSGKLYYIDEFTRTNIGR